MTTLVEYICPHCGSNNIGISATAYWSLDEQGWVSVCNDPDSPYECGDCDETTYQIGDWERPA